VDCSDHLLHITILNKRLPVIHFSDQQIYKSHENYTLTQTIAGTPYWLRTAALGMAVLLFSDVAIFILKADVKV
jgi:hypothetical protein